MARIWLARHGEAAARWGEDPDPGLSARGREQAAQLAARLTGAVGGPVPVLTSPLRRCVETAAPLCRAWDVAHHVDPAVGEIVPPEGVAELADRPVWLRDVMASRWSDLSERDRAWRRSVLDRVTALRSDTVVVTHFVLSNVVVGAATGDDRVVVYHPANCSVTVVDVDGDGGLHVVELGAEIEVP